MATDKTDQSLGLGVTFTATVGEFSAQLQKVEEQLKTFVEQLETLGVSAEKSGKTLTDANVKAEEVITKVEEATKKATSATEAAAKVSETLASGMAKVKSAVSGAGSAASKAASDLKGLTFEQTNMLTGVGKLVSEPVMGSLVDKLKKAGTESIGYQKGLVGVAKEAGNSVIAFNNLSSALLTNEKYLSTVADGTKKVRSELGAGALPKDMNALVEGVDRLKFAQATLAGEMYKTGGVVLDGKSKFVELQKTIAGLTATHGEAAMKYTEAASRLGSYGTTVKSITNELKAYNTIHSEALGINENIIKTISKMNAVYGGPGGLATSTGNYRTEYDKLLRSYTGSENEIVGVEQAVKRLNSSFVESEKGVKGWNEAIKGAGVLTPKTAEYIQKLQSDISGGVITQKEATKALSNHNSELAKLAESANRPRGILAGLSQSLLGGASAANKAVGYFARLGTAIGSLAAWIPAAMIISGLTEAIAGSVSAVKDYEQTLKSLQAISGGTEAEISLLGKEILHVSDTTKYSAAEIAKGAIFIAQAGFTAGESLQVIAAAARGAQGTLEPLAIAADLLTTILRAFHIDADQAAVVMDKLAMAANKSKTDLEGMKTVFNYLGPAAFSAGIGLDEALGALMALSNVGMRMSTVGTSLRQVFIGLENPSAKLTSALKSLGMTTDDLSVKKMGSLEKVLKNLDKVIGGSLTNAVQFFNVRAGNAALVISQMNEHVAMMIQYTKEYGASAAMAGIQTEGMSVKISMLHNQFQNFIIRMAEGGLTKAFNAILDSASGLIKVIEYLVNNPFSNFIITTGIMFGLLVSLKTILISVVSTLYTYLLVFSGIAIETIKTMTIIELFGNGISALRYGISILITTIALSTYDFTIWIVAITKGVAWTETLRLAWLGLTTTFATTPIGLIIAGLALLAATIYTVTMSSEKQSKALQENTITLANNASSAEQFSEKLRSMDKELGPTAKDSDSYVAVLKQIRDTFPEVTNELVKNKDSLKLQAIALDNVAANYRKLNESAAKIAMADLTRQYQEAGVEVGIYSRTLTENRSLLEQTAIAITAIIPGILSYVGSLMQIPGAAGEAHRAWILLTSAWGNMSSAQLANDSAIKMEGTLNRQRELYPQVASIIINSSKIIRQSLIDMIPEGEMKRAALGTVEMHDKMVASLKVGMNEVKAKELDAVAEMGAKWVEYYSRQEVLGQTEVAQFAANAKKKIDSEMKVFEKANTDPTLRNNERIRLEQEFYQKMLDLMSKNVENLLKLEDKLYEEQHKRRKEALSVTLGLMELEQKQEITALGDKGLAEAKYLKQEEDIKESYFQKNKKAIEDATRAELTALESVHQAKIKTLELDTTLTDETKKDKRVIIETENSVKLVAIYKDQLAAYKSQLGEKTTEFNKYKGEYDKTIKEMQKIEDDRLQASLAANKKYQKELVAIALVASKQEEDLDKLRRDALQSTMTAEQVARDKVNEFNETIAKGYKTLSESENASDSITKKEKVKDAQDYFKEAQGMIKGLVKENVDADGKVTMDKEATKNAQLGFYDEISKANKKATADAIAAATLEKEETIKANEAKRASALADMQAINKAAKEGMDSSTAQIKGMIDSYKEVADKLGTAIKMEADSTKTMADIKKIVDYIDLLKGNKSLEVVLTFMGKASDQTFLGEKIIQITGWINTLASLISGKVSEFLVNFKGNDNGWFWLGSLMDSLTSKMNTLFNAANRTATFTTIYKTEGTAPSTSSDTSGSSSDYSSSQDNSGPNGPAYHAEGAFISGTGSGDKVSAMLEPGEGVIRRSVVSMLGGERFVNFLNGLKSRPSIPRFAMGGMVPAFAGGGMARNQEVFTLNLQAGSATLPLKVVGNASTMRQNVRRFEKELDRMRLSRG